MDGLYQNLLDRGELQKLQNAFCAATGVYAVCVSGDGINMTDVSGDGADWARLLERVPKENMMSLFHRISESDLEEQAVEDTDTDAVKYAVVSVKEDGRTVLAWLVYGVLSDALSPEGREFATDFAFRTTQRQFGLALDLLREIGRCIVRDQILLSAARAESQRERHSKEEMEGIFRKDSATAKIMRMLDSDEPIETVLEGILAAAGSFLKVDRAYLYSVDGVDTGHMAVAAQWSGEDVPLDSGGTGNLPRPSYLYRNKPVVISSSSGRESFGQELDQAGIKALAAFPVILEEQAGIYVCFEVTQEARNWEIEEIRFLYDSVKALQSILGRPDGKNSPSGEEDAQGHTKEMGGAVQEAGQVKKTAPGGRKRRKKRRNARR